ncbi:MAG: ABC transporter permease [Roseiarcus sp.]
MASDLTTADADELAGALRERRPRKIRLRPSLVIGACLVLASLLLAVLGPMIAPDAASRVNFSAILRPPLIGWHVAGTDQLGRDVLMRIATGLRVSFAISLSSVTLALVVGLSVGLISGYFGGIIDLVLMRLTDIQMALPFIVLAVAILSVTQPGYFSLTVVLSLAAWPTYARVVRGIVQVDRNADYVQAALAIGASHTRVIVRYLLRDLFGSMLVLSILDVAAVIIYEATLTFIGMGVPPGTPSLGSIMAEGKNYIATAWWITAMAGLAMLITIAGLNLVAIALRSSLKEANTR